VAHGASRPSRRGVQNAGRGAHLRQRPWQDGFVAPSQYAHARAIAREHAGGLDVDIALLLTRAPKALEDVQLDVAADLERDLRLPVDGVVLNQPPPDVRADTATRTTDATSGQAASAAARTGARSARGGARSSRSRLGAIHCGRPARLCAFEIIGDL
jgi:hypothetical protein